MLCIRGRRIKNARLLLRAQNSDVLKQATEHNFIQNAWLPGLQPRRVEAWPVALHSYFTLSSSPEKLEGEI